jgi:hypothetical protein
MMQRDCLSAERCSCWLELCAVMLTRLKLDLLHVVRNRLAACTILRNPAPNLRMARVMQRQSRHVHASLPHAWDKNWCYGLIVTAHIVQGEADVGDGADDGRGRGRQTVGRCVAPVAGLRTHAVGEDGQSGHIRGAVVLRRTCAKKDRTAQRQTAPSSEQLCRSTCLLALKLNRKPSASSKSCWCR